MLQEMFEIIPNLFKSKNDKLVLSRSKSLLHGSKKFSLKLLDGLTKISYLLPFFGKGMVRNTQKCNNTVQK